MPPLGHALRWVANATRPLACAWPLRTSIASSRGRDSSRSSSRSSAAGPRPLPPPSDGPPPPATSLEVHVAVHPPQPPTGRDLRGNQVPRQSVPMLSGEVLSKAACDQIKCSTFSPFFRRCNLHPPHFPESPEHGRQRRFHQTRVQKNNSNHNPQRHPQQIGDFGECGVPDFGNFSVAGIPVETCWHSVLAHFAHLVPVVLIFCGLSDSLLE